MSTIARVTILVLLACMVVGVIALKQRGNGAPPRSAAMMASVPEAAASTNPAASGTAPASVPSLRLPRFVELGSVSCAQCKAMQPIVAELEKEYAGALEVQFFDVWADPMAGSIYRVETIPTQVFLDEHGKEVFRHHGFYAKSAILAKWRELGYRF